MRSDPGLSAYYEALREENALWEKVRKHPPGTPGFDPDLWNDWVDAVCRTSRLKSACGESPDPRVKPGRESASET